MPISYKQMYCVVQISCTKGHFMVWYTSESECIFPRFLQTDETLEEECVIMMRNMRFESESETSSGNPADQTRNLINLLPALSPFVLSLSLAHSIANLRISIRKRIIRWESLCAFLCR